MIKDLNEFLVGIVVGARFRANFSIEDQLGRIVDQILYSEGSFFDPTVFPTVRSSTNAKTLICEETQDQLRIDNSNFILEITIGEKFLAKDCKDILHHYEKQIINGVMKSFAIKEIVRMGYIKRYIFGMKELAKTFVDKTIGKTLGGINDINLSFSKKFPVDEALVKKSVHDYDNAIFNIIKKADREEIFMAIDYQKYFDPFLPTASEIKYASFIEKAEAFNQKNYLPWLISNYIEEKNESKG
jgi:hypothetical protein